MAIRKLLLPLTGTAARDLPPGRYSELEASVQAFDLKDGHLRELCNPACGFAYRTSIFNTSERGRDIRRELASAVVSRGWGLLELRPMRMSLEDIFLSLTTEDTAAAGTTEATHG